MSARKSSAASVTKRNSIESGGKVNGAAKKSNGISIKMEEITDNPAVNGSSSLDNVENGKSKGNDRDVNKDEVSGEEEKKTESTEANFNVDATNAEGDNTSTNPLEMGKCLAKRGENWLPAEIIQRQLTEQGIPDQPNGLYHYYVHYEGSDRRLDTWLNRDQVDVMPPCNSEKYLKLVHGRNGDSGIGGDGRKITRSQKRCHNEMDVVDKCWTEMDPAVAAMEREREAKTKIKYIRKIEMGEHLIDAWYFSPYPDIYGKSERLWICEYCLSYFRFKLVYLKHLELCHERQPPGNEIYRHGPLSIYEVDGSVNKTYCQQLCLLAKLFLDHKTLYYDVGPFLFYILCRVNRQGAHIVGYFSKEKNPYESNNVACIMTLPPYQRKGYGRLMIEFSYELSKIEKVLASPEKPLSDLGMRSYRAYWSWALLEALTKASPSCPLNIKDLSRITSITEPDICSTLQCMNLAKYWKGNTYVVRVAPKTLQDLKNQYKRPKMVIDRTKIKWWPIYPKVVANNSAIKKNSRNRH